MIKFGSAFGSLSVLALVWASPVRRQAAPAAPQTTVTAFIPVDDGPPRGTFYAITGVDTDDNDDDDDDDDSNGDGRDDDDDKTYLVGLQTITTTNPGGAASTAVLQEIYAFNDDELDHYLFDEASTILAASECDIDDDDTTAECDGLVVDLAATAFAVFDDVNVRVTRTAIPAYLPTGSANPAAISAAFNAVARISSFKAGGGANATRVGSNSETGTITPTILPGGVQETSAPASGSAATASTSA